MFFLFQDGRLAVWDLDGNNLYVTMEMTETDEVQNGQGDVTPEVLGVKKIVYDDKFKLLVAIYYK